MVAVIGEISPETLTGRLGELLALGLDADRGDLYGGEVPVMGELAVRGGALAGSITVGRRIPGALGCRGELAGTEVSLFSGVDVPTLVSAWASPVVGPSGLGFLSRSPVLGFPSFEDMVDSTSKDNLRWDIHHTLLPYFYVCASSHATCSYCAYETNYEEERVCFSLLVFTSILRTH